MSKGKSNKKFKIPFELVCVIMLVVALTAVTMAWLPRRVRDAKEAYYRNNLIISSLNLDIEFQVYDEANANYLTIAKYVNNELVAGVNYDVFQFKMEPGDIQSYRFIITNLSSTSDVISDVSMRNLFYKSTIDEVEVLNPPEHDLFQKIGIYISAPSNYDIPIVREEIEDGLVNGENQMVFFNDLTIPKSETINLDWYVELSTTTGNEFWGYKFGFDSIYFSV